LKIGLSSNALKFGGGLERYAMDLVRGLAAHGIKPAFFARRFDWTLPESGIVEAHRINVSFLPGKLRDGWFSWRLGAARRLAQVDVLIGCNRVDSSEIAICGGTHRGFLQAIGRAPRLSDRWQIALETRQYERAKIVVAHSGQMRDELCALYGIDDAKIRVLLPPVDSARFSPCKSETRAALRQRFGFDEREVVLLFPSGSHERKGLPLIEAALRGTNLPVVVAVAGRPSVSADSRIRYLGYVKDIEDCYRAADFTIQASSYEPFGLVAIESVLCGTPVILSTNIGCWDAIATSAKFGFAPGNVEELRATLLRAVRVAHEGRNVRLADEAARDAVLYDTSVASHVATLVELASDIVARRRQLR